MSGGHLCEAEAPTEPTGETADPYIVGEVIPLLGDSPNRGDATQWQRGLPSAAEQKCLRKQTKGSAELQILCALPKNIKKPFRL